MRNSPHFPYSYNPKRILLGDVDGDGLADVVYVDDNKVTLWINQSGNAWSDPLVIEGTPAVSDMDGVRLADILGSGVGGVLWSVEFGGGVARPNMFFLDFTGGLKPYLLNEMNNHIGAVTKVEYAPSTRFFMEDQKKLTSRWKTVLPFPVQVVAVSRSSTSSPGASLPRNIDTIMGTGTGPSVNFTGSGWLSNSILNRPVSMTPVGSTAQKFLSPKSTENIFHRRR